MKCTPDRSCKTLTQFISFLNTIHTNWDMHIKSEFNCSDVLTKHWGYNSVWQHILQPLFHYSGNTANLMYDDTLLVDTTPIDETEISSLFSKHGEYEIL